MPVHEISMRQDILARSALNKGGEFALTDIDPQRTAHLIIDLQNGFMEPGAPVEVPVAREIVDNVNTISKAVRDAGGLNIFFRFTVDPQDNWSAYLDRFGGGARHQEGDVNAFTHGTHNHALYTEIQVEDEDIVLNKTRFSAFTPGASNALEILQSREIDTVIVTGTLTNCCCESTARDANQLNYNVIFVSDANAAVTDEEHNSTLNNLATVYADIRSTNQVANLLANTYAAT
jgi:ureidoacrylate peracid hydrolase